MNEWQPIETAPKDGESILAWLPHLALPGCIYYSGGHWRWVTNGGWAGVPTHWMPLPPPPEIK